jgi:hypothetical protein
MAEKNEKNTINTSQTTIMMYYDMVDKVDNQNIGRDINNWFEIPHQKKKWIINIRNFESEGKENNIVKTFEGIQDENDEIYLQEKISRFASIVLGNVERYHHGNFKKCIPCEYSDMCKFSLKT